MIEGTANDGRKRERERGRKIDRHGFNALHWQIENCAV